MHVAESVCHHGLADASDPEVEHLNAALSPKTAP